MREQNNQRVFQNNLVMMELRTPQRTRLAACPNEGLRIITGLA